MYLIYLYVIGYVVEFYRLWTSTHVEIRTAQNVAVAALCWPLVLGKYLWTKYGPK